MSELEAKDTLNHYHMMYVRDNYATPSIPSLQRACNFRLLESRALDDSVMSNRARISFFFNSVRSTGPSVLGFSRQAFETSVGKSFSPMRASSSGRSWSESAEKRGFKSADCIRWYIVLFCVLAAKEKNGLKTIDSGAGGAEGEPIRAFSSSSR